MSWKATVLTLFPEMFPGALGASIPGRALQEGHWTLDVVNIRDYAQDARGTVDDRPYGGGAGMVMLPEVIGRAMDDQLAKCTAKPRCIFLSPRGRVFTQRVAEELTQASEILLLSGRYEGVDQRVLDAYDFEELSLGDFVLSGGEIAAMAVLDACVRTLPGVLEKEGATGEESFGADGFQHLLEYPHFTRPEIWRNRSVPDVLLSGHHEHIQKWRRLQAEELTQHRRPDLWRCYKDDTQK